MKFTKLLLFCISSLLFTLSSFAQGEIKVSGKVTDETGMPVPGATVTVKGTTNASLSDIDGNYVISANPQGTLVFTYIGYTDKEVAINGQATVNTVIQVSTESLEEVVVVGYGTQKKSVVTGAISQVKAEAIEGQPVTRIEQTLQGRTSGVIVAANAGQPGSPATVRVRGITTLNNNDPLYVVDGILVDAGAVQFLNQYDIESIEVLKDASASVYGTRAAGGVILITTKKGKSGKISVSYNGFAGFSKEARRLDVLNATEYATLINEREVNDGRSATYADPAGFGKGTDWQDVIFQNASRESHDLSISGGTEKSKFYASFSLIDQEGIVLPEISRYQRKTFRLNSEHKIGEYVTVGQTATYSHEKNRGVGNTNSEFGGPLSSALNLDPITPLIITDPEVANAAPYGGINAQNGIFRDSNGNPYGISNLVTNEMANPLAYQESRRGGYGYADNLVGNVYVQIEPIKGLKLRSTGVGKLSYYGSESFTPEYYFNSGPPGNNDVNNITRVSNNNAFWSVENTATYTSSIKEHNFSVLVGQGSYVTKGERGQGTTYRDIPIESWRDAAFFDVPNENRTTYAYQSADEKLTSVFGRLTYDYNERYLFSAFVRRDGSTKFGENHKFGNFPSISAGWVPSKESFWPENNIVTQLKFRGSWGVTGNDRSRNFGYASLVNLGYGYTIGGSVVPGGTIGAPANPDVKWEETTQRNIAVELTLFRDLNLTMDLWKKKTTGILGNQRIPAYSGLDEPLANIGEVENHGFEVELGYRKKIGDFTLGLSGNISFVKNEVVSISDGLDFYTAAGVQSLEGAVSQVEVGHSFGEFYGYTTKGIFQNQSEIDNYVGESGNPIQPNARPGDFRYEDANGDGQINGDDRGYIGNPLPDYTYGFTINLEYKNFDFNVFAQGAAGNQIFNAIRRLELTDANFQSNALNRWTGEGTSNDFPRMSKDDPNGNFTKPSDFYLEDGDYLRIKTIQLGYSLPTDLISSVGMSRARIYLMAENLFTFTKYTGFDPEIGGNVFGIDRGYYPQARSFMMGVNLQF